MSGIFTSLKYDYTASVNSVEHCLELGESNVRKSLLATHGVYISLSTITRARHHMGWIYRGSASCQLIREVNREKRLQFAMTSLRDNFDDAIFSDETTVQLETHRSRCYRKEREKP